MKLKSTKTLLSILIAILLVLTVVPARAEEQGIPGKEAMSTGNTSDDTPIVDQDEQPSTMQDEEASGDEKPEVEDFDPQASSAPEADIVDLGLASEAGAEDDSNITAEVAAPTITSARAHVQGLGWRGARRSGSSWVIGTTGQGRRLEAISLKLDSGSISYRVHCQTRGWLGWAQDGAEAGTTGQAKRLECVQIKLDDALSKEWSVQYRCHVQTYGWLGWAENGDKAGSTGLGKRVEAVEVRIVPKDTPLPSDGGAAWRDTGLVAQAHVQRQGWMATQKGYTVTLGTTGRGLRVEALKLSRSAGIDMSGGITYRAHVQGEGWQSARANGAVAGSTGKGKRVEAIAIDLTGDLAGSYDIWYRVHVQKAGWLDWAKNGQVAGSEGLSLRIEAIEIKLLSENSAAPGRTDYPSIAKVSGNARLDVGLRSILRDKTGTGPDALRKAYDYVTSYDFKHYAPTPSAKDNWKTWSKEYAAQLLDNKNGNCYRYSALFSWIAIALGYDSEPVIGRIQSRINVYSVHCWSEVKKDGVVYLCDPDLQKFLPEKDFYMQTYEDAPAYFYDSTGWPLSSYR